MSEEPFGQVPSHDGPPDQGALANRIDAISLTQALKDFEVANARVVDLTSRLTELNRELLDLRSEHERLRLAQNRVLARVAAPRALVQTGAHQALRVARAVRRRIR